MGHVNFVEKKIVQAVQFTGPVYTYSSLISRPEAAAPDLALTTLCCCSGRAPPLTSPQLGKMEEATWQRQESKREARHSFLLLPTCSGPSASPSARSTAPPSQGPCCFSSSALKTSPQWCPGILLRQTVVFTIDNGVWE